MASKQKKDYTKLKELTECKICQSELTDPRQIDCGHVFCLQCISQHYGCSSFCPTCKRPMKPKLGKVENYPVAIEMIQLRQLLQTSGHIKDEETDDKEDKQTVDENQYEIVYELKSKTSSLQSKFLSQDICDIHGLKLAFVCTSCDDELICAKCSLHYTHEKIDLSDHNKKLQGLLEKLQANLLQRQKDDNEEDVNLQGMVENKVREKEDFRNEVECVAEEMFSQIHMKKEELLRPIDEEADEYVKQLTERQEYIKDRKSELSHISNMIEKLPNDDTADYNRKAKRLVKRASIAMQPESKPIPPHQHIEFGKNEKVLEDLSKLQLGCVVIDGESMEQEQDGMSSDFIEDNEHPGDSYYSKHDLYDSTRCDESIYNFPKPRYQNHRPRKTTQEQPDNRSASQMPPQNMFHPPPLPPRHHYQNQTLSSAQSKDQIYNDLDGSLYDDTTVPNRKHDPKIPEESVGHPFNPPPISPFSGTFRKSVSVLIDIPGFHQKPLHRVFLPFRPSGFTVVRSTREHYYTFVTDAHNVQMFKQNGDFYKTITDVVQPFDAASQQHGESLAPLYITDEGRRIGDGSVREYTNNGTFKKVLVGKLRKPQGISVSRVGLVYVCDEANILVFCPKTGKRKRVISTIGKNPIFVRPLYVMVSATGKILVSDVGTRELQIHDETRNYTDKFKPDQEEEYLYTSFTPGMCAEDSSSNYLVIDQERNVLYILRGGGRSEKLALPQKPLGHDGIPTAVSFVNDTGNIVVF